MPKFVNATSPGGGTLYWINVNQVNFVQQSKSDTAKCTVKFADDRSITIEMSVEDFAARANDES